MIAKWEPGRFSEEFMRTKSSGDQEPLMEELELFLDEGIRTPSTAASE
jgi:hypothetical protein